MQYERGYGPCLEAAIGVEVIEIVDGRTEGRWPGYIPTFLARGALSSIAVPVPAAHLSAALNVYVPVARAFTDDDRDTLAEFGAIYNAVLGRHFPALAVVVVSGLVVPLARIEIETTAVVPE